MPQNSHTALAHLHIMGRTWNSVGKNGSMVTIFPFVFFYFEGLISLKS